MLVAEILLPDDIYIYLRLHHVARLRAARHGVCRGPSSPPSPSLSILRALYRFRISYPIACPSQVWRYRVHGHRLRAFLLTSPGVTG